MFYISTGKTGACKKGYFPCGPGADGAVQCVRDYLVCDGSADCKSGADEADDVCGREFIYRSMPRAYFLLKSNKIAKVLPGMTGSDYVKVGVGHGARIRDLLLLGTGALTMGPPPPRLIIHVHVE